MTITIEHFQNEGLLYVKDDGKNPSMKDILKETHKCMRMIDSSDEPKIVFDRRNESMKKSEVLEEIIDEFDDFIVNHSKKNITLCNCNSNKKKYNYKYLKKGKLFKTKAFTKSEIDKAKTFLNIKNGDFL